MRVQLSPRTSVRTLRGAKRPESFINSTYRGQHPAPQLCDSGLTARQLLARQLIRVQFPAIASVRPCGRAAKTLDCQSRNREFNSRQGRLLPAPSIEVVRSSDTRVRDVQSIRSRLRDFSSGERASVCEAEGQRCESSKSRWMPYKKCVSGETGNTAG